MILPAIAPALALLVQLSPTVFAAPSVDAAERPVVAPPITRPPLARTKPSARQHHAKGDPLERYNRYFFARQQGFDRHFLRPVALGYKHVVPDLVRTALRNFFRNLGEPLVFLNYVLQLKPGKAAETAARFAFNSTIGVGGTVDVAKSPVIHLPHRPNGFGDTLGYYGVGPGPYLFLPLLGPTTLRDLIGGQGEALLEPFLLGTPFDRAEYQVTRAVTSGLDARAEADGDLKAILGDAVDPYATFRSVFLQDRAGEIADLHGPAHASAQSPTTSSKELGDALADPAAASATGADVLQTPPTVPAASRPAPSVTANASASTARELLDPLDDPPSDRTTQEKGQPSSNDVHQLLAAPLTSP